jgi:pimeloyl-ACP methyl ester carboxylesterase
VGVDHIRRENTASPRAYRTVDDYARHLAERHILASPLVVARLAEHGLRLRENGLLERTVDPRFERCSRRWRPERLTMGRRYVEPGLWEALGRIQCPTLVVRGISSSVLAKDVAERMGQVLRDGAVVTVPLAGHAVMVDNPVVFGEQVASFLRSCTSSGSRAPAVLSI